MKFLVDAQLPARLARVLSELGHDALHTSTLPNGNRSADATIASVADVQNRVVVTKDADFRHSHLTSGTPRQLLVVSTGNISNADLLGLIESRLDELATAFVESRFVELRREFLIVHRSR